MKIVSLLTILFSFTILNAQINTNISDTIFEQHLIDLGYDNVIDGIVLTSSISSVDSLTLIGYSGFKIDNLIGIEDFSSLQYLNCSNNNISSLDLNNNMSIKYLDCSSNSLQELLIDSLIALYTLKCSYNNLSTLNTSGNLSLTLLECINNKISALDLKFNKFLGTIRCGHNNLMTLDLSDMDLNILQCEHNFISDINLTNNHSLRHLTCHDNLLESINLNSSPNLEWLSLGNSDLLVPNNSFSNIDISSNCNITNFYSQNNQDLSCIRVCNISNSSNWIYNIDVGHYFSEDCNTTVTNDLQNKSIKIISIVDLFGREKSVETNTLLFYIFEDGSVNRNIILE